MIQEVDENALRKETKEKADEEAQASKEKKEDEAQKQVIC
jgi:hypothetical protein